MTGKTYVRLTLGVAGAVAVLACELAYFPVTTIPTFLLGLAAATVAFAGQEFTVRMNLEALMREQAKTWEVALPGSAFDPKSRRGIGEVAQTPSEWLRKRDVRTGGISTEEEAKEIASCLAWQVRSQYDGVESMDVARQCMALVAGVHAYRGGDEAHALRGALAGVATSCDGIWRNPHRAKDVIAPYMADFGLRTALEEVGKRHAYEETALLGMVAWARAAKGVLPSSEFLWLKNEDRTLWYALNGLGREAFHVEGLGVMAHYEAEVRAGGPLKNRKVDAAVRGLQHRLDEEDRRPPRRRGASV